MPVPIDIIKINVEGFIFDFSGLGITVEFISDE